MPLSAIKAHHSGLMQTDWLIWEPLHFEPKAMYLIADSSFLFSLCLTSSNTQLRAASHCFSQGCVFLHQDEFLSSQRALLFCDISYRQAGKKSPERRRKSTIQDKNPEPDSKLPTTPRLSLYLTIWNDSSHVLVGVPDMWLETLLWLLPALWLVSLERR